MDKKQMYRALAGFKEAVAEYGLICKSQHVVLGFSGGADSTALFHILANSGMNLKITTVHVNHGLRGAESDGDEEFCAETAKMLGAELVVYRANAAETARVGGITLEEAGRELRYNAFREVMEKQEADVIAVAHNKNDNAETVIMRFFRGTGSLGLGGIPVRRGDIVRPLLFVSREDIEEYCTGNGLRYRVDSSNTGSDFTRNKVRNLLLPLVKEQLNPSVLDSVTGAARVFAAEDAYLERVAAGVTEACLISADDTEVWLDAERLAAEDKAVAGRVIRLAFSMLVGAKKDFGRVHVEAAFGILYGKRGKKVSLCRGVSVRKGRGTLVFSAVGSEPPSVFCYEVLPDCEVCIPERKVRVLMEYECKSKQRKLEISGEKTVSDEKDFKKLYTIRVNYDKIKGRSLVRSRLPGDKLYLAGAGHKKLKDYFCGLKLEPREHSALFCLADSGGDGNGIIAVLSANRACAGFVRVSDEYLAQPYLAPHTCGGTEGFNSTGAYASESLSSHAVVLITIREDN